MVDELSSFKSNSAKRFKSLRIYVPWQDGFWADRDTGTNGLLDLWPPGVPD